MPEKTEDKYIILGESFNSRWLVGFPNTDRDVLKNEMNEMKEKFPQYSYTIIPYTLTLLNEIYPQRSF